MLAGLLAATASAAAPARTPPRLVPNATAFADPMHGLLGTGWRYGTGYAGGAIESTSDGGRTWRTVSLTPRPVVSLTRSGSDYVAQYDDGETLRSRDGRHWRPVPLTTADLPSEFSDCPQGMFVGTNAGDDGWWLCTTQPAAGNQGKSVYRNLARGRVRVACTPFADLGGCKGSGYGGISGYGYALGIAGAPGGFGLIWESRGTLYVTRDGGRHWTGLPKVVRPEIDFGSWAFTLRGDTGWAIVGQGRRPWRLIETTDAGRTWHVVHRWP
jgi:hypothetical protein